ncbi:hypothetical protein [Aureimonas pseudogalii]|uniref:Uncharacterized protein n=1 Tax=Aureimonas pseudogalii TaxID=1744844 RepID=A0A7W6H814_9HYPH|nr:hypothetical protein [Aureimonas pseudogalii]MBB4000340.1 hypothetical protein [Aureimonas pseudogalii]
MAALTVVALTIGVAAYIRKEEPPQDRIQRHAEAIIASPRWARAQIEASLSVCINYSPEASASVKSAVADMLEVVVTAYAAGDDMNDITARAKETSSVVRGKLTHQQGEQVLLYMRSANDAEVSSCLYDQLEARLREAQS